MTTDFYDKVAKKFGSYHTSDKHITEYSNGDPEKVFKGKLLELAGKDKIALDVGCADGRFALSVSPYFKKIVAIDLSKEMLKSAKKLKIEKKINNVFFEEQDAFATTFEDISFDIVYTRRGPSNYKEALRLLKQKGYFVEINIGGKDCQEIKEVFGRGQNFGEWNNSRIGKDKEELKSLRFEMIFAEEYFYNEYYASYEDLDLFLQGVPIFEDFDSEKDKINLTKYVSKFQTNKGIKLPRHRIVLVAQKNHCATRKIYRPYL